MGRQKKPTNLRLLQGNPGRVKINKKEPQPEIKIPESPMRLEGYAKEEWERITPILERLGLLSDMDASELCFYCQCFGRAKEAEEKIRNSGFLIKTTNGNVIQNPLIGIANRAMQMAHQFLCQFGMTPASRSGVTATKAEPQHKLAKFKR